MMADIAVCEGCGVDVRDESSFCYNCGKQIVVSPDAVTPPVLIGDLVEETRPSAEAEGPAGLPGPKPALRSAATLRKQRRAFNRQPVEVRWERPTGLGIGFILTAILLTTAAFVLLVIALYLR